MLISYARRVSLAVCFIALPALGQSKSSCPAPPASLRSTQANIFSEQQEQWLGDASADMIERNYRPVNDPAENAYLEHITKRLLASLPPTSIQFRVILVDSPDVNGFSLAGGRIYLTRKLVANARNEDEVATVIAHEMGHIVTHQIAIEYTADLKRLLNVTAVTDRADVYAKFQRLADAILKDTHSKSQVNSDAKQDEADVIAVYASAAAGYNPRAYSEFWDRMFFVEGKVGGPFSDFFGITRPESKRLRAILKIVNALPAGCGGTASTASSDFEKWHALVTANQSAQVALDFTPATEVALTPPLRVDLDRLRYSPDGKYILAQDETSITVLSRDPFKQLFRFDADAALPANFSPDSQRVVFNTPGLHTEEWSIAEKKLVASHEPIARRDCLQSRFSPDGRTIFCLSLRDDAPYIALSMLDAGTGALLFEKRDFFEPSIEFLFQLAAAMYSPAPQDLLPSSLSPDGKTLLIGPSKFKLAFDLQNRIAIPVGTDLKNSVTGSYAFIANDKVLGIAERAKESGIFSYPEGQRLQTVPIGLRDIESVSRGNYVLSHDIKNFATGVVDYNQDKFIAGSNGNALDIYDDWVATENATGSISLRKLGDANADKPTATLALSPLGRGIRAALSPDGKLLLLSARTRGGVWDIASGKLVFLSRHFNGWAFAPDGSLYIELPKVGEEERRITRVTLVPLRGDRVQYKLTDAMHLSVGMLQEWKTEKKVVTLTVHSVADNSILWTRSFPRTEPAHTDNLVSGQTIFSFPLSTDFARAELKSNGTLALEARKIKDKDLGRLLLVLDDASGNLVHEVVVEVPSTYAGVANVTFTSDTVYVPTADNRTIAYAASTGEQLHQMFGAVIAIDSQTGRVCTSNRRGEATVYDSAGQQLAHYEMGTPLRFAGFRQNGSSLLVLTADQKLRTMPIAAANVAAAAH